MTNAKEDLAYKIKRLEEEKSKLLKGANLDPEVYCGKDINSKAFNKYLVEGFSKWRLPLIDKELETLQALDPETLPPIWDVYELKDAKTGWTAFIYARGKEEALSINPSKFFPFHYPEWGGEGVECKEDHIQGLPNALEWMPNYAIPPEGNIYRKEDGFLLEVPVVVIGRSDLAYGSLKNRGRMAQCHYPVLWKRIDCKEKPYDFTAFKAFCKKYEWLQCPDLDWFENDLEKLAEYAELIEADPSKFFWRNDWNGIELRFPGWKNGERGKRVP